MPRLKKKKFKSPLRGEERGLGFRLGTGAIEGANQTLKGRGAGGPWASKRETTIPLLEAEFGSHPDEKGRFASKKKAPLRGVIRDSKETPPEE